MFIWFTGCVIGFLLMIVLHYWSLEHEKLEGKFGKKRGAVIGKMIGTFSGWMELVFLIGFWVSPQPRFTIFPYLSFSLPLVDLSIPMSNLIIAVPFIGLGAWIAIRAVRVMNEEVGFEVIDAHAKPEKIVKSGPYSFVRHPQYLGADLAHIGGSILFSASFGILLTPIYLTLNYFISRKEEKKLAKEMGKEYEDYQEKTPMFIPYDVG